MADQGLVRGRELFRYTFEPTGTMRVLVSEDVDPRKAIAMLEKLIALKKEEVHQAIERGLSTSE